MTEQQQRILTVALKDFRGNNAARQTAMKRALSVGPIGAKKLLEKIEEDQRPLLDQYRAVCTKLAKAEYEKRAQQTKPEDLQKLRDEVLKLRQDENLTKEKILEVAEPAVKKLAQQVVVDRIALLSASPEVRKLRPQLLSMAPFWETCQALTQTPAAKDAKDTAPAPVIRFESYLEQIEQTAIMQAAPIDAAANEIQQANATYASRIHPEEFRCLSDLNLVRILLGLKPLKFDEKLLEAARGHSADMAREKFFAHESPVAGKKSFTDRAKLADTTASGENIYMGSESGSEANQAWFHSPGHFKNMLGDHQRAAIGKSGIHWTELFGG